MARGSCVIGEQGRVGEREDEAKRLGREADVREQVDAARGDGDCRIVTRYPRAEQRKQDRADELDRRDGRERQPVDRLVEARVHGGEDAAQPGDQQEAVAVERAKHTRRGRRQSAKTSAADAIRNKATPSTSARAKSSTANDGPR